QTLNHRRSFDVHRLDHEDNHQGSKHQRKYEIAEKQTALGPEISPRGLMRLMNLNVFVVVNLDIAKWRCATILPKHIAAPKNTIWLRQTPAKSRLALTCALVKRKAEGSRQKAVSRKQ